MENRKERTALYQKLVKLRQAIGAIGKDSRNRQQDFKYRGYEALYSKARPVMDELGIWVETDVSAYHCEQLERGAAVSGMFTMRLIDADSGEFSEVTVPMYGSDYSDKAAGKACSYAMKYAFFTALMIPTDEDMDAQTPRVERKSKGLAAYKKSLAACKTKQDLDAWKELASSLSPAEKGELAEEFTAAVARCK